MPAASTGVIEGHAAELVHESVLFPVANHRRQVLPERVMFRTVF